MTDTLLHFADEAAAIAALPELRVLAPSYNGEMHPPRWADTVLPVVLVTAEAVYGEPIDMTPVIISPRVTLPGFYLLTTEAGQAGQVAAVERETGRIVDGDQALAGVRLDPVWAGAEPMLAAAS